MVDDQSSHTIDNLRDLIDIVTALQKRGIGVRSLTNGTVDTTIAHGGNLFGE